MTALVAMERLGPRSVVTVDRAVRRVPPITEGLRPGERVEAWKLFYGLLLYSGNDDALALAIGAGGHEVTVRRADEREGARARSSQHPLPQPERAARPRQLLERLGPGGAHPLRALEPALPRRRPHAREARPWSPPIHEKIYVNKNHLIGAYPGADGVKTGWTTVAKHCLVASARRDGVHLIAVVLGADDSYADARKLLDWGFARPRLYATARRPFRARDGGSAQQRSQQSQIGSTASATSSVTCRRSRSSGEIFAVGERLRRRSSRAGRASTRSRSATTGNSRTLSVWISVSDSNSSSSVPKPPGKRMKPSAAFTSITLRA